MSRLVATLICLTCVLLATSAQAELRLTATLGGTTTDMAIEGSLMLFATGERLHLVDVEDVAQAQWLAERIVGFIPSTIAMANGSAFAARDSLLEIYDVSDTAEIQLVQSVNTHCRVQDLLIDNGRLFARSTSTVKIFTIHDQDSLAYRGSIDVNYTFDIACDDTTLYVKTGATTIVSYDLSDPSSPSALGTYTAPSTISDMVCRDHMLYVSSGDLLALDATDPSQLVLRDSLPMSYPLLDMAVNGDQLSTWMVGDQLVLVDVTNPDDLQPDGVYPFIGNISGLLLQNGRVAVRRYSIGVEFYSLTAPDLLTPLGLISRGVHAQWSVLRDGILFMGAFGGIWIVDVTDHQAPQTLWLGWFVDSFGFYLDGDRFYVHTTEPEGILVLDVSNPSHVEEIAFHAIELAERHLVARDGVVYTIATPHRLVALDMNDPQNIVETQIVPNVPSTVATVSLEGNLLMLPGQTVEIYNVGNPSNVVHCGSVNPMGNSYYTTREDEVLCVEGHIIDSATYGVQLYHAQSTCSFTADDWIQIQTPYPINDIMLYRNRLAISLNNGLRIYNVSDPDNPILEESLPSGTCEEAELMDDMVCVSRLGWGLSLYEHDLFPTCEVSADFLDFGTVPLDSVATRTFTISNTSASLLQGSIAEGCAGFSVQAGAEYTLPPGASQEVTVAFQAASAGDFSCTLDMGEFCADVALSAVVEPPPFCQVEPDTLDFGTLLPGSVATRDFTITNVGGGTLSGAVEIPGGPYSLLSAGLYSLDVNQSQSFTVQYLPSTPGPNELAIASGLLCGQVLCRGASLDLQLAQGPASACGLVEELGHQSGSESGFLADWSGGLVGVDLDPAPSANVRASIHVGEVEVWNGPATPAWRANLYDLTPWIGQDVVVHLELDDGVGRWNIGGDTCLWDLRFAGVEEAGLPRAFDLHEARPNPFNPATSLQLDLPVPDHVRLEVLDLQGRRVELLFNRELPAGVHVFTWQPHSAASGTYFVVATGARGQVVRKVLLLK